MRKNFLQKILTGAAMLSVAALIFLSSCAKDGKDGATGLTGANGKDGKDASETCKLCHNPSMVDSLATQFQLSKHEFGLAADEEAGSTTCTPCHCQEAFKYVCANNTSTVFYQDSATGPWKNPYATAAYAAYGRIGCYTCHNKLHNTYGLADLALTTTAAVPMTMWGGTKTIDLTQDGGKSNLCVKCHQPRPLATQTGSPGKGKWLDYPSLAANPTGIFFDSALATTAQLIVPGYRTHIHYGAVGAVFAGKGGVEFGTGYSNSNHTTKASCEECHMAPMTGSAGGHSFKAKGNFNGCNNANCHVAGVGSGLMTSSNAKFTAVKTEIKGLLNTLAGKLKEGGVEILNKNPNTNESLGGVNLWAGLTTGNYDGYLNVYDPINNPNGPTNNAGQFRNLGNTSSWSTAQKATNLTLPKIHLTNAQMGAIVNFQFCLREYSLGIHNYDYVKTLLNNSIAVLP